MQASRIAILGFGSLVTGITLFSGLTVPGLGSIDAFADDSSMSSLVPGSSSAMSTMSMSSSNSSEEDLGDICLPERVALEAALDAGDSTEAAREAADEDLDANVDAYATVIDAIENISAVLYGLTHGTTAFNDQFDLLNEAWDDFSALTNGYDTYEGIMDGSDDDADAFEEDILTADDALQACLHAILPL